MTLTYALLVVDTQYDFLPGGALAVPDGDKILHPIALLCQNASLVIASRDWHPENHFSFSDRPLFEDGSWPVHCVQGTRGAKLFPSVRKQANYVVSKGMDKNPPDAYSAFSGKTLRPATPLLEILERSPIDTIVVCGLALDYCVAHTAFDSNALGYKTIVPLDATRPVNKATGNETLAKFAKAQIEVVETLPL